MSRHLLTSIIVGFLIGVFIRSIFSTLTLSVGAITLVAILVLALAPLLKRKIFFLTLALVFSFAFGIWHAGNAFQKEGDPLLAGFVEQNISFKGMIVEDPDERQFNTRLIVHVFEITEEDQTFAVYEKTKILVTVDSHYVFRYGDTLSVSGTLKVPENFETDTGRTFDYASYLGKSGIYYRISYGDVHRESVGGGNMVKRAMLDLKNIFVRQINKFFPQPEGALLGGVLFGEQSGMGDTLQDYFRKTGIVHIVVLSGFNVTIVAVFIIWILGKFLRPRIALLFGIIGIILFALLVGAGATVLRASAMAILAIIARLTGREYEVVRGLFTAAFFMVLMNPKILLFDISFQLSFLATLSLIIFSPLFEKYFRHIPEAFTLRETFTSTFAAQVLVLPLLLYSIGEFSIVSPIVNILVVPWVSFTMLLGFFASLFSLIWSGFGMLFMIPTYLVLHMQIKIVEFFGSLPFASLIIPQFPVWVMVSVYVVLFALIGWREQALIKAIK